MVFQFQKIKLFGIYNFPPCFSGKIDGKSFFNI